MTQEGGVRAVFLSSRTQRLLGYAVRSGEKIADPEAFVRELGDITRKMATDFPGLQGVLAEINRGDHSAVIERGWYVTLVVIFRERPGDVRGTDRLRREMRKSLSDFEAANQEQLRADADARGLVGAEETVQRLLAYDSRGMRRARKWKPCA